MGRAESGVQLGSVVRLVGGIWTWEASCTVWREEEGVEARTDDFLPSAVNRRIDL